ncbi:ABC transporter ATP-binding protein [Ancylothrix sp. C2]|uniref:ABC transporter ATP-binding protein n=1 Tax=Ancylothrix sp. D3o TaxID=2953691 RepID=UPI0021BBB4F6|nr:ABC transporter ATP-binding protein [Ancylothrix sp. D3o]MCT7948330.1 ABC transporter ATP-binding protein [Ancylothrix sp. D3o]
MESTQTLTQNSAFVNNNNALVPPELEVIGMTKKFGTFTALDNVHLHLKPGTFHALLGENGAGKSTLVKCIMGFHPATTGQILLNKQPSKITNPRKAHKYGIGMVYQHFTSVPAMTVAENLILSRLQTSNLINWRKENENLKEFMAFSPFQLPLEIPICQLAAGEKQKLEILKQLYLNSRILILDEPTSVLTPQEADEVLGLLREQVEDGKLSVLMISHKFREVRNFADEITVLRKGKFVGTGLVKNLDVSDMAKMMLGEIRPVQETVKISPSNPAPILQINNLHSDKDNGLKAISNINLTVQSGEIVGIAGISGNGQKELVEVLAGQRQPTCGELLVNGEKYTATRAEMFRHKVFTLPEEPLKNACVPNMSVAENLALRTFDRPPQAQNFLLNLPKIRERAINLIQTFAIKTPTPETPISNLSGGNIQRSVLARELSDPNIKLLIAANPCFGLDFAAVEYIHNQIIEARNRGVAVLLVSEDLDELFKLADKIVVMSEGKIVWETLTNQTDISTLGQRMAGH